MLGNKQLKNIQNYLIQVAEGNFDAKLRLPADSDIELIAIQVGINMLTEELKSTTISRSFLDSVYNGINDMLIVLNDSGEIQTFNNVVLPLMHYSEEELHNQKLENLVHIDSLDVVRDCLLKINKKNENIETGLNLVSKNGIIIPVSCSFSTLHNNKHDQSKSILFVAKDITALLNAKEQLQHKNDELNLFIYKASHDLKSPVSSMLGIMSLLNKTEDKGEVKAYLKMMEECINKSNALINDLLVLGRITYSELKDESISIKTMLDDIIAGMAFVDGYKDIHFNVTVDDKAKFIITEKGLIQTVLLNLIENAIKYRRDAGEPSYINIRVSDQESGILIQIEDNGIGIEESLQADIFKMFYRATLISKGSGLGLHIVKKSIAKLGGTISFESTFYKGTTFNVYIPYK